MVRNFALVILAFASLVSCVDDSSTVLHNVNVIDSETGEVAYNRTVFIKNGTIDRIVPAEEVSVSEAEDMDGKYVMAGLIDSHVHWGTFCTDSAQSAALAREYLINGVTTVRDMGSNVNNIRKYLSHVADGDFNGPDVYYSAMWGDGGQFFATDEEAWMRKLSVKGMDDSDIEEAVAEVRKSGCTGIKIYEGYSKEDLARMIPIIRNQGLKAWGHASQGVACALDVAASGMESVSHSYLLIDNFMSVDTMSDFQREYAGQVLKKLKENDVILDATAHISHECDMGYDGELIQMAYEEGVEIAVGTDYFGCAMENEIKRLSSYGISNKDLIRAATFTGAKILGKEGLLGVVRPGAEADLIVLSGNPLEDLDELFDVHRTYSDGKLVYSKYTRKSETRIPEFIYDKDTTTINIHLLGAERRHIDRVNIYVNSVLSDQKEYSVPVDSETGKGSISFSQCGSAFGFVTMDDIYLVGRFRIAPRESVDFYCDLSSADAPEMRTCGSVYDSINNLPPDEVSTYNMLQEATGYRSADSMSVSDYAMLLVKGFEAVERNLETKDLHPLTICVKKAELKLDCIEELTLAGHTDPAGLFDLTDPMLLMCEKSGLISQARLSEDVQLKNLREELQKEVLDKLHSGRGRLLDMPDVAAEDLFEAIISPHKGKVILVDFWNTWCGPCRSAIKHNEPYKDGKLAGDDLVWIYIANETSPLDKYLEMISDIRGLHYRVDNESWKQLTSKDFVIDGIPSYVLVQRDGSYELRNDLRDHKLWLRTLERYMTASAM